MIHYGSVGWRLHFVVAAIVLAFGAVLVRLYDLHVVKSAEYGAIASRNRKSLQVQMARRGDILDRRGHLLAATRPIIELGVDPQMCEPKDEARLPELARLLGLPLGTLRETIARKTRPQEGFPTGVSPIRWAKLAEKVDEITYSQIQELRLKGIYGNRRYERYYPNGPLAAHLLGYIGFVDETRTTDGQTRQETVQRALMGIERFMDFYLRGQDGWRETEHDGRRRELPQYRSEIPPTDGLNVEMTLDAVIQSIAEAEVARLVQEYRPAGVTAIVSEPSTGEILALANYPSFDPNEFWKSDTGHLRNRAVSDIFEPGSTFKIVTIAASLEEGLVRPETIIDCASDTAEFKGRRIRLPTDSHKLGLIPVREVVAHSSNRGAAQLGMRLGEERMYRYARAFGFGEESGFGPGGEVCGILHPVKRWDGLTISRLPAGYAVGATPLQVHLAMSAVANGGVLTAPQLVRRVSDAEGRTVLEFRPQVRRRAVSAATASRLAEMLQGVTAPGGTATKAAIPGYQVAGKTGTARKIIDGRYSTSDHVASFTGFFPASRPALAITVVVDDPNFKGVGYGGVVAAPAFRNIAEQIIQYLALEPVEAPAPAPVAAKGGRR